jgi:hypothetical protein
MKSLALLPNCQSPTTGAAEMPVYAPIMTSAHIEAHRHSTNG